MKEKEEQRLIELKKIEKEIYDSGAEYICGIISGTWTACWTGCNCCSYNAKIFNDRRSK